MYNENNVAIIKLLFECVIDVPGFEVGIKIYEDAGVYSFTQSIYLQDKTDLAGVYKPGHGAVDTTLEGLIGKINLFKKHYSEIIKIEPNPSF